MGIVSYFRSHPTLLLLLMSPGIPEYISGSSPMNAILLNPPTFPLGIVANLGLYGPGVLLIREAKVRWQKGWATVLLLGAAYGILEEGVGLSTLFYSKASPVGQLGFYGHWVGVNWIWSAAIVPVHTIFSISIPILLLGLTLPETNGRSLLKSDRSVATALAILTVDIFSLFLLIRFSEHYIMTAPPLAAGLIAVGILVYAAWKVPASALTPRKLLPSRSPLWMGVIGALYYPIVLFVEFLGMGPKLPSVVDFVLVIVDEFLYLLLILRITGQTENERNLTALVAGLILPIALFGLVAEAKLPLSLIPDAVAVYLLWRLWRKYPPKISQPTEDQLLLRR